MGRVFLSVNLLALARAISRVLKETGVGKRKNRSRGRERQKKITRTG